MDKDLNSQHEGLYADVISGVLQLIQEHMHRLIFSDSMQCALLLAYDNDSPTRPNYCVTCLHDGSMIESAYRINSRT